MPRTDHKEAPLQATGPQQTTASQPATATYSRTIKNAAAKFRASLFYKPYKDSFGTDLRILARDNYAQLTSACKKWLSEGDKEWVQAKRNFYETLLSLDYDLLHATKTPLTGNHVFSRREGERQNQAIPYQLGNVVAEGDQEFVFTFLRPRNFPYPILFDDNLFVYAFDLKLLLKAGYDVMFDAQDQGYLRTMGIRDGFLLGDVHYSEMTGPLHFSTPTLQAKTRNSDVKDIKTVVPVPSPSNAAAPRHNSNLQHTVKASRSKIRRFITADGKIHDTVMQADTEVLHGNSLIDGLAKLVLQFLQHMEAADPNSVKTLLKDFFSQPCEVTNSGNSKQKEELIEERWYIAADLVAKIGIPEVTIAKQVFLLAEIDGAPILREICHNPDGKAAAEKLIKHAKTKLVANLPKRSFTKDFTKHISETEEKLLTSDIRQRSLFVIEHNLSNPATLYFGEKALMVAAKREKNGFAVVNALMDEGANLAAVTQKEEKFYQPSNALTQAKQKHNLDVVFYLASEGSRNQYGMPTDIVSLRRFPQRMQLMSDSNQLFDQSMKVTWDICQQVAVKSYSYDHCKTTTLKPLFARHFVNLMREHIRPSNTCFRLVEWNETLYLAKQAPAQPGVADVKAAVKPTDNNLADLYLEVLYYNLCEQEVPKKIHDEILRCVQDLEKNADHATALRQLLSLTENQLAYLIEHHGYLPDQRMLECCKTWLGNIEKQCATYIATQQKQHEQLLQPITRLVHLLMEVKVDNDSKQAAANAKKVSVTLDAARLQIHCQSPDDHLWDRSFIWPQVAVVPYALGCRSIANYDAFQVRPITHDFLNLDIALHGMARNENGEQIHAAFANAEQILLALLAREFKIIFISIQNYLYYIKHRAPHPVTGQGATESFNLLNDRVLNEFQIECKITTDKIVITLVKLPIDYDITLLPQMITDCLKLKPGVAVLDPSKKTLTLNLSIDALLAAMEACRVNYQGVVILNDEGAIALAKYGTRKTSNDGYCGPGGHCSDPYYPKVGMLIELEHETGFVPTAAFDEKDIEAVRIDHQTELYVLQLRNLQLNKSALQYKQLHGGHRPFKADVEEFLQGSETFLTPQQLREYGDQLRPIRSLDVYLQHEETMINDLLKSNSRFASLKVTIGKDLVNEAGFLSLKKVVDLSFGMIVIQGEIQLCEEFKKELAQQVPNNLKPIKIYQIKVGIAILNIAPYLLRKTMTALCSPVKTVKADEKRVVAIGNAVQVDYVVESFTQMQLRCLSRGGVHLRQRIVTFFDEVFLSTFAPEQLDILATDPKIIDFLAKLAISKDLIKQHFEKILYFLFPVGHRFPGVIRNFSPGEICSIFPAQAEQLFAHLINDDIVMHHNFLCLKHGLQILQAIPASLKPSLLQKMATPMFINMLVKVYSYQGIVAMLPYFNSDLIVLIFKNLCNIDNAMFAEESPIVLLDPMYQTNKIVNIRFNQGLDVFMREAMKKPHCIQHLSAIFNDDNKENLQRELGVANFTFIQRTLSQNLAVAAASGAAAAAAIDAKPDGGEANENDNPAVASLYQALLRLSLSP